MAADMDYTVLRFWSDIAQTAATVAVWIYVWLVNRKKAMDRRFSNMAQTVEVRCQACTRRIDELEKEETALQMQVRHMPTHKDIKEMSEKMESVKESMSKLSGRLEGVNRAVDLINEFLINQGAGARK